MALTAF